MEIYEILLLVLVVLVLIFIGFLIGKWVNNKRWKEKLPGIRDIAIAQSRAVLSGQFSEQLAPYLPDFPYKPTECRFIGEPIDLVIFKGADEKDIKGIEFVEVKSGKSALTVHERKLRDAIRQKKVTWSEYRVPEELTKKKKGEEE